MQIEDASMFDITQEFSVLEKRLPHWAQAGAFAFVTFRLIDSVPTELARQFARERVQLLKDAGLNPDGCQYAPIWPTAGNFAEKIAKGKLSPRDASILRQKLFSAWDKQLDQLRGDCVLRRHDAAQIVSDGLLRFDGDRYLMAAFVIMPNHVHLLAAFEDPALMTSQGEGWRRYFARQINKQTGRHGHLWQEDQFDHLVRSEASFERIRRYIIDNPLKTRLRSGEYRLYVSPQW